MSEEHVQAFKRGFEAGTRFDVKAVLEELHPRVEWHPLLATELEREATVYRGHEGVREWLRDLEEAFAETHMEFPEIRDLGDRIVAIGRLRARGRESGAETVTPIAYVVDYKDGKAIRVRSYLDPEEALEAAGLRE
jgi:ketosteroid isomerase-like protein